MMRGAGRGTEPFVIALIAGLGPGRGEFALLRARTAGEDAARSVTMPRTVAVGRPALSGGSRTGLGERCRGLPASGRHRSHGSYSCPPCAARRASPGPGILEGDV